MIRRRNFTAAAPAVKRRETNLLTDELTLHTDFEPSGGRLKKGLALIRDESYKLPPAGSFFAHLSDTMKHFGAMVKSTIYVCTLNSSFVSKFGFACDHPFAVEDYYKGDRAIIYFCGAKRLIYSASKYTTQSGKDDLYCGAMHCDRLFAAPVNNKLRLRWTAFGALDWDLGIDGGGYIDLPVKGGQIIAILDYKGKVAVFRKNGITLVDAYGEPQHYTVRATETYLTSDEIIPETIAMCGGNIYFFTQSCMWRFDGSSVEKPVNRAEGRYETPVFAAGLGGKYYFKCRLKATGSNVICVYDCASGDCQFIYHDASSVAVADTVYPLWGTAVYKISESEDEPSQWHSRETDFGTGNLKCLTEIYCDCAPDAEITVSSELGSATVYGAGRHKIRLAGRKFSFSLTSAKGVDALTATTEEIA